MALLDTQRRFAARTAEWILKARFQKEDVVVRISMFNKDHVKMIGEEALRIKGAAKKKGS